jgi:hypothetical protein
MQVYVTPTPSRREKQVRLIEQRTKSFSTGPPKPANYVSNKPSNKSNLLPKIAGFCLAMLLSLMPLRSDNAAQLKDALITISRSQIRIKIDLLS